MADNTVKFYQGSAAQFATATKDANTLYFITDERRIYKGDVPFSGGIYETVATLPAADAAVNTLYVNTTDGSVSYWNGVSYQTVVKPSSTAIPATDASDDKVATEKAVFDYIASKIGSIDLSGIATNATAIEGIKNQIAETKEVEGVSTTESLNTTSQTLIGAINEVKSSVGSMGSAGELIIDSDTTESGDYKTYKIYQGEKTAANLKGTINVPLDMVVSSGEVKTYTDATLPTGTNAPTAAGTYIVLTVANGDTLYINVADLVDTYTAEQNASQVQLAFNGYEIGASLVNDAVDSDQIKADAIITAKIADKNVTKAKLEQDVQDALDAAGSAVQAVAEGSTDGTIDVDGTDVAVHGLNSAAYQTTEYFVGTATDAATANTIYGAKAYTDSALTWGNLASS